MNLQNGQIKVRDIMRNPQAREIFNREFPGVVGSPMFNLAQNMSLNMVLSHVRGKVPQSKIDKVLRELQAV